jgi:hypothetical protein
MVWGQTSAGSSNRILASPEQLLACMAGGHSMTQHMATAGQPEADSCVERLHWACAAVIRRLETGLKDFGWSFGLVSKGQTSKLALSTGDLYRGASATRDDKCIDFGSLT